MWIPKFNAHLDATCDKCGEELEFEIQLRSEGFTHDGLSVKPCTCYELEHKDEVDKAIDLITDENKDSEYNQCLVCYNKLTEEEG